MIDAHCHLADREFETDLSEVVSRAKQAGVRACLVNTECKSEFQRSLDLATQFSGFLISCFGIHPVQYDERPIRSEGGDDQMFEARSVRETDADGVEDWFAKHHTQLVAIGEVGLDFTPRYLNNGDADKDAQKAVFRKHIELGKQYDLPLICHSRSAGKPVISFLIENGAKNVLLHAFDGNVKSAQPGIDAGFHFSIPPCAIRGPQKQKLIAATPLEQLLLETDSPVLGPEKDKRNEPANLRVSAQLIAEIKGIDVAKVIEQTTANAMRLFPKLRSLMHV